MTKADWPRSFAWRLLLPATQDLKPFDKVPERLKDSTIAEHLQEVCELDLAPLDAVPPPKGFGHD